MPFDIKTLSGLSEVEARRRLSEEGYNELPVSRRRGSLQIAFSVAREPMFLLLVACGVVYLGAGEHGDALMLLGFVLVVMGITIFQERRTERALEALRDLSSPRALVIRDGQRYRIAGREVVRGDYVVLAEGDRVPADGELVYAVNLTVDESLLTGESVPVRKVSCPEDSSGATVRPGGDDLACVFSGTLVSAGHGVMVVRSVGADTQLGKIGKALHTVTPEATPLQRETGGLVKRLAIVGLSLCALVVILYGITRGNTPGVWKEGFLAGLTMAMATLPEEFPVVLTIFLALGAWRISQSRVLTRRMPAVEALGAATVLCVDKTGTLTQNRMTVRSLMADGEEFDTASGVGGQEAPQNKCRLPEQFHRTLEYAILAGKRDPFDPMEKALQEAGNRCLAETEHLHWNWSLVHEYPLSPDLLAISRVWRSPDGGDFVIAAKGAPEAIADLCHLSDERRARLSEQVARLAGKGLRVLGVAQAQFRMAELPEGQHAFRFQLLGLAGLEDPIRPTVPAAIGECYGAGIRVVMITGDYPGTARSIARQIGLRSSMFPTAENQNEAGKGADVYKAPEALSTATDADILTGTELDKLDDFALAQCTRSVNIFARVAPEQKLRLVNALKSNGEVVAMTGDGVNDAAALKSAHIGIAMGGRGADVARESAAIVLLDDDFSSIVQAVRLGRRIFDNIRKATAYILAIHVPIAGLCIAPVLAPSWPLILLPVHVVFLELIIDPACSIIFEAEAAEPDIMKRPPRNTRERLFSRKTLSLSLLQGFSVLALVLGVFALARHWRHAEDTSRALTFVTLVVANLCLILTNRSWYRTIISMRKEPNKALKWVVGCGILFLGLILYVPSLRSLFHFGQLHTADVVVAAGVGVVSVLWFEALKAIHERRRPHVHGR